MYLAQFFHTNDPIQMYLARFSHTNFPIQRSIAMVEDALQAVVTDLTETNLTELEKAISLARR